jgi:transcription termination factor NusB
MKKDTQKNLLDFINRAYLLTKDGLKAVQNRDFDSLVKILDNREKAINIASTFSERLALYPEQDEAFNNQVNQVVESIAKLDDIISSCLEHEKTKTQFEIAKTHKNKENFKGYNLNRLK